MIYLKDNKSTLCKGNFCPAQFYKGDKKIAGYEKETFEGEGTITLENCYNDKIHNAKIYGNTIQNGEPSPENPVEMQSVGDLVTEGEHAGKYRIGVTARGKNLFDKNNVNFRNAYIRVASNQLLQMDDSRSALIECQPNTTYTIRHTFENKGMFRACYINSEPPTSGYFAFNAYAVTQASSTDVKELTVTTGDECKYLVVQMPLETYEEWIEHLEVTTSQEEPRQERFDIYLDEPLRKVGDYADSIDFEKGVVVRTVGAKVFDGTENWNYEDLSYGNNFYVRISDSNPNPYAKLYCNRGRYHPEGSLIPDYACRISTSGNFNFRYRDYNDVQSMKGKLKEFSDEGIPLSIVYALKTSVEEKINLPEIPTFKGVTVYEIKTQLTAKTSGEYKWR